MPYMPLGQAEIFDPPATRRLIVPEGAGAWWGCDPGTSRVAIATVAPDGLRGVSIASFARLEGGERLSAIYARTRELAGDLAALVAPGVVLVEQPSGKQPNPALSYAVGVTMAAIFDGVLHATGNRVTIETVSSSSWKKVSCGYGAIYKPKSAADGEYGVLRWARSVGYSGDSFDEVDAMGVCECARKTFALDQR